MPVDKHANMEEKLWILEDLNMMYIRQIALSLQVKEQIYFCYGQSPLSDFCKLVLCLLLALLCLVYSISKLGMLAKVFCFGVFFN